MSLTPNQQRFFELLDASSVASSIEPFFDREKRQLRLEMLESQIGVLSHGEQLMLQFFAGLWLNKNQFEFDLFDAASTLDESNRSVISEWLEEPFWP